MRRPTKPTGEERSTDGHRPGVTSFVHIGLVVDDLDETVRFLTLLGLDCGKPGVFSGEWIGRIIGLKDVTVELVMVRGPDGSDVFEVVRFHSPSAGAQSRRRLRTIQGFGTSASRSTTCVASSIASEWPAGKRSGRSSTTRARSSSATSAVPRA